MVIAGSRSHERPYPYVAYIRVSTQEQGRSDLGLDAQRATLERHIAARGGRALATFSEVASARHDRLSARPELVRALGVARRTHATLVVARLDRLGRSVPLVASLLAGDVAIEVADLPGALRVALHFAAVMVEYESQLTSKRTHVARERGVSFAQTS